MRRFATLSLFVFWVSACGGTTPNPSGVGDPQREQSVHNGALENKTDEPRLEVVTTGNTTSGDADDQAVVFIEPEQQLDTTGGNRPVEETKNVTPPSPDPTPVAPKDAEANRLGDKTSGDGDAFGISDYGTAGRGSGGTESSGRDYGAGEVVVGSKSAGDGSKTDSRKPTMKPGSHDEDRKKDKKKPKDDKGGSVQKAPIVQGVSGGSTASPVETAEPEEPETAEDASEDAVDGEEWDTSGDWTEYKSEAKKVGKVYTEPGRLPHLQVAFLDPKLAKKAEEKLGKNNTMPLEHTHVDAKIVGPVARVKVQQKYSNPFDNVIEAVYVFPLPENAAVDGMRMVIEDRVIEGVIKKREEARAMYEEAKAAGKVAALLEQERPNIFTQSVANIAPKAKIDIDIRYVQDLSYDSGSFEFVFPMVVGPRYLPEGKVSDAERITPPVLGRGDRSGNDISLSLSADAGVPIRSYEVPTHEVDAAIDAKGKLALSLAAHDKIPNRDFVLRYDVAEAKEQVAVLSEIKDKQGYLTLVVQPPEGDMDALVGTREIIFVVDVSGSMAGVPISMCKEAMVNAVRRLRPVDTFNIMTFASGTKQLFDRARPVSSKTLESAAEFIEGMESGGGTQMLGAVTAALEASIDANMTRVIVFMTDGYIGNEDQILKAVADGGKAVEKQNAKARIFAMGVGSSTNRYLIDGLGTVSGGNASYASNREDPTRAVDAIFGIIDKPILTDLSIDWGDAKVERIYPSTLPDFMASRPLVVHARYAKATKGKGVIKAQQNGNSVEIPFSYELASDAAQDGVLGTLWARAAVEQLERDKLYSSDFLKIEEEITQLGLDHSIVTPFTSFVAIDQESKVEGKSTKVKQGVESPEGVKSE